MNRSERLDFLVRRNAGRHRLPEILQELSSHWGRALTMADVGGLEVADRLRKAAVAHLQVSLDKRRPPAFSTWAPSAVPDLERGLAALGRQLSDRMIYFFSLHWNGLGPIRIDPPEIFLHALATAQGSSEEFLACSDPGTDGLFLAFHASDAEHGEPCPYELVLWGEEWIRAAEATVPFACSCSAGPQPAA